MKYPLCFASVFTLVCLPAVAQQRTGVVPQGALTPPVTITSAGPADALSITVTGSGRGILASVENASNPANAIAGTTRGSGAGVAGTSTSNTGPAGRFYLASFNSLQPAIYAYSVGRGNAITGVIEHNGSSFTSAAVYGQHNSRAGQGVGVRGVGGYRGVIGEAEYIGVLGNASIGVYGASNQQLGEGVVGYSTGGIGIKGTSYAGAGGSFFSEQGDALTAAAIPGKFAGVFTGDVSVSNAIYTNALFYTSDRNEKTAVQKIAQGEVLDKIASLDISSWAFRNDPTRRHIGPMAQDFHAAFELGSDEKRISVSDMAGVTLLAVKELIGELRARDEAIASLQQQVKALQQTAQQRGSADH